MLNTTNETYRAFFSELEKIALSAPSLPVLRNIAIGASVGGYTGSKVDPEHKKRNALIGAAFGGLAGAGSHKAVSAFRDFAKKSENLPTKQLGEHIERYQPLYDGVLAAKKGLKAGAGIALADWAHKKLKNWKGGSSGEKSAEIMPPQSEHITRTSGSPVPRGPRLPEGGRVGTTTATPFSGNKAKVAGLGHAAVGLGALGLGLAGAHVAHQMKEPVLDILDEDEPERRLAVPIREPRRPSMFRSSFVGQFAPERRRRVPLNVY